MRVRAPAPALCCTGPRGGPVACSLACHTAWRAAWPAAWPGALSCAPPSRRPSPPAGTPGCTWGVSTPWQRSGTCCTPTVTARPRSPPWRRRGSGLAVEALHRRAWTQTTAPCCTGRRGSPEACTLACRSGSKPARSYERCCCWPTHRFAASEAPAVRLYTAPAQAAPLLHAAASAPCPLNLARWSAQVLRHRLPHPARRDVAFFPPRRSRTVEMRVAVMRGCRPSHSVAVRGAGPPARPSTHPRRLRPSGQGQREEGADELRT